MILLSCSNSSIKGKLLKFLALFCIFLFYDRPFLYVCNLEENALFSTLILGSVFNDYVVFYGDIVLCTTLFINYDRERKKHNVVISVDTHGSNYQKAQQLVRSRSQDWE